MPTAKYGERWSRDELVLALYLYCQTPFARTKANNPEVRKLAALLGRTPASVARKLGNFGAFDPQLAAQGISGLVHASRDDKLIWDEFRHRWETLVEESARLLATLSAPSPARQDRMAAAYSKDEEIIVRPSGPSERTGPVLVRLFQSFFRRTVLASYNSTCCVCGLDIRSLLVASHIKPWSIEISARSEPENGLCLCAIHDRAFDRGLMAISGQFQVVVARNVLGSSQRFVQVALSEFHTQPVRLPKRFVPRQEFLRWHLQNIFEGAAAPEPVSD